MNIVITGVSRGIGNALCKELQWRKGHRIVGISRSTDNPSLNYPKEAPSDLTIIKGNIASEQEIEDITHRIKEHLGSVDVLIHNAGFLLNKPFGTYSFTDYQQVMNVNFFAPFFLTQAVLPLFNRGGHIMNIGSMGGVQGSVKFPGLSLYSAAKGALAVFSEALAEELKPAEISVNCLALGSVQTEMLNEAFPNYKASFTPDEIAVFLADFAEKNYRFFNGKILPLAITTP